MWTFLDRGRRVFDRWVFESTYLSGPGLGLFRIFVAGGLLLLTTPAQHAYLTFAPLADLPDSQFAPPFGPMMLFTGFPGELTLQALEVVVTIGLVSLAVGYRTRASSVLVALTLLFLWGMKYSGGKIDHGSVIVMVMLLMMSFTPWDRTLSLDAIRRRSRPPEPVPPYQWVGAFLAFVLGLAYLAAGLPKLLGGWLDPSSHAVRNLMDLYAFRADNPGFLVSPLVRIDHGLFWELFDYVATGWEVGFILAVFSLRTLRPALATAVVFHMANALVLGIIYFPVLWFYALFIDWDAVLAARPVARVRTLGSAIPPVVSNWYVAAPAIVTSALALYALGSPVLGLARWALPDRVSIEFAMLTVAALFAVGYLVAATSRLILRRWGRKSATSREGVPV